MEHMFRMISSYCGTAAIGEPCLLSRIAFALCADNSTSFCAVFLIYDYTITFGREVDAFWSWRFSGATVLFLSNKYLTLLNHLLGLSTLIPVHVSDKVCRSASTR